MRDDFVIEPANSRFADSIAELYYKTYQGNYSLTSFTKPEEVRKLVDDGSYVWYIAHDAQKVVASAVGTLDLAHNKVEYGKGVVDPSLFNKGLMRDLLATIKQETEARKIDLSYSQIRNRPIYQVCTGLLEQEVVGYLPGAHLVEERETHLFSIDVLESGKEKRVASPIQCMYNIPFVAQLLEKMELKNRIGEYPDTVFVQNGSGEQVVLQGAYNSREKSFSVLDFEGYMEELPQYLEAVILADKVDYIRKLLSSGFTITAFLPAWYLEGDRRYDCALLTIPIVEPVLQDSFLQKKLEECIAGFGDK